MAQHINEAVPASNLAGADTSAVIYSARQIAYEHGYLIGLAAAVRKHNSAGPDYFESPEARALEALFQESLVHCAIAALTMMRHPQSSSDVLEAVSDLADDLMRFAELDAPTILGPYFDQTTEGDRLDLAHAARFQLASCRPQNTGEHLAPPGGNM